MKLIGCCVSRLLWDLVGRWGCRSVLEQVLSSHVSGVREELRQELRNLHVDMLRQFQSLQVGQSEQRTHGNTDVPVSGRFSFILFRVVNRSSCVPLYS